MRAARDGLVKVAIAIPSDLILDVMRNAASTGTHLRQSPAVSADTAVEGKSARFADVLHASTPPADLAGDLLVDVMKAADSNKLANAEARMTGAAGGTARNTLPLSDVAENSPQKSFEQMFIRNMLEAVLPSADSGIYGDEDASSGVWRSLAADQLASVYTNAGGLGIASEMLKPSSGDGMVTGPRWPYFIQSGITSYSG